MRRKMRQCTLKCILGSLERGQSNKLDRLAELVEILDSALNFFQAVSDGVWLGGDLEDLEEH
jgi:hypothetical protein